MSDIREQIAEILRAHAWLPEWAYSLDGRCECGESVSLDEHCAHVADVLAEQLPIPPRTFTDDQGRRWEWCGGKHTDTWAWRVTSCGD